MEVKSRDTPTPSFFKQAKSQSLSLDRETCLSLCGVWDRSCTPHCRH